MKGPDDDVRKELEDLSPRLLRLKEQGRGLKVPEDYFQRLQEEVLEKVQQKPQTVAPPSWSSDWWKAWQFLFQPRWALSLATVAILLTVGGVWFFQQESKTSSSLSTELAKVDRETLNTYIQANLHDFDTETLMEFAASQEGGSHFEDLTPEELDDYLDEVIQDMDAETLKELL